MAAKKITLNELRSIVKQIIKEEKLSDYSEKWYGGLIGLENLDKYPQEFIDWLDETDSWAQTYVLRHKVKKLIDLFDLWVNEKY